MGKKLAKTPISPTQLGVLIKLSQGGVFYFRDPSPTLQALAKRGFVKLTKRTARITQAGLEVLK